MTNKLTECKARAFDKLMVHARSIDYGGRNLRWTSAETLILALEEADRAFVERERKLDEAIRRENQRQPNGRGVAAFFGTWPGGENEGTE